MAETFLPPVVARLAADISEFQAKMGEARGEMDATANKGSSAFQKLAGVGKVALIATAALAIGVGVESIKMADEFEAAHARLETAVKNSGVKMESLTKTIDLQHSSFEKLGYSNDQYEAALARLTQATNDPKKALGEMGVVADLAAARHMDLEAAATLVGKVAQGNTAPLKRLGIDLGLAAGGAKATAAAHTALEKAQTAQQVAQDKLNVAVKAHGATSKQATDAQAAYLKATAAVDAGQKKLTATTNAGGDAIAALGRRFDGAANDQAKTFHGQLMALEAGAKDMAITIGMWLIPKLQEVASVLMDGAHWLMEHKTIMLALAGVIGGFLVTAMAAFIALKIASVVQNIAKAFGMLVSMGAKVIGFFTADTVAQEADTVAAVENAAAHEAAAASMEASGAAMAGSEAAGAGLMASLGPLALGIAAVAAVGYGLYSAFNDASTEELLLGDITKKLSADMLSHGGNVKRLTDDYTYLNAAGKALGDRAAVLKSEHETFGQVLQKQPQYAENYLAAMAAAGMQTDKFTSQMQNSASWMKWHQQSVLDDANAELHLSDTKAHLAEVQANATHTTSDSQHAILEELDAVVKNSDAHNVAATAHDRAKAAADAQRGALLDLKSQFPDLAAWIQTMIDKLNNIPTQKNVRISAQYDAAIADVMAGQGGFSWGVPHSAAGNYFPSGGLSWVGEQGPELRYIPPGGGIIPNDVSMGLAGGGGNVTLAVTLHASTAAGHDSQAGNQILEQLMVAIQRSGMAAQLRQALGIPSS